MLLEGDRNGRLARCGETSEPDGAALLLAKVGAFSASEACVPGDVAVDLIRFVYRHARFVGGVVEG